jgi:hypothetical protein
MSMTMMIARVLSATAVATFVVLGGCAGSQADVDDAPVALDDELHPQQIVYSAAANGTWSANALNGGYDLKYQAVAQFGGPGWATRRMGVCALKQYKGPPYGGPKACNTAADCAGISVPAGGFRYCVAPNGVGAKTCFIRPGPATTYCAGTPANGGVPIPPSTVATGLFNMGPSSAWLSYACFEGCAVTDPSSSSTLTPGPMTCPPACQ